MFEIPITLAQAAAELPDPTPGQIIAGLSVMSVMAGSLVMIAIWVARWKNGEQVMPFAARKPLCVPWPLTRFGLFLATMMAVTVFASGTVDPELLGQADEESEVTQGSATESEDKSSTSETVGDAEDSVVPEADTAIAEIPNAGESISQDDDDAVEEAVDTQAAQVEDADVEQANKLSPAELKRRLRLLMMSNIASNGIVFAIFGLTILFFQQRHSRRLVRFDDVGYADGMTAAVDRPVDRFPDLDARPSHAAIPDSTNPFAAPAEARLTSLGDSADQQPLPLEKWSFGRELLFAFQTFLIAYLPTTLIRVLIVSNSPDTQSHPFLEMLENGVDPEIMILIFLMAVVVAPIVEELMFRVAIFGGMYQRGSFGIGLVISSVLFGLAHGYPDCFALLPLAFAIAFTYSRRRSYRTAVLIHFLFNGFNMMLAGVSML